MDDPSPLLLSPLAAHLLHISLSLLVFLILTVTCAEMTTVLLPPVVQRRLPVVLEGLLSVLNFLFGASLDFELKQQARSLKLILVNFTLLAIKWVFMFYGGFKSKEHRNDRF